MADVELYTTPFCGYCRNAKALLARKGVAYREIDVSESDALREAMTQRAGGRYTVPQIFIDGRHIGGFDDLNALDRKGGLDPILGLTA